MKNFYAFFILLILSSSVLHSVAQIIYQPYSPVYDLWYKRIADIDMNSDSWIEYILNADHDDTSRYIRITSNYNHQILSVLENGINLPKVLNNGDPINSSLSEWTTIPSGQWFYLVSRGDSGYSNFGYWFGQTDKYLGVRFNRNGDWYYGWIQVTISTDTASTAPNKLIAKAYNGTPNGFLTAGQQSSGINDHDFIQNIFSSGKKVFCKPGRLPFQNLLIMNSMGQIVYKSSNTAAETEIDLSNQPEGVYFINVLSGSQCTSMKFVLR